MKYLVLRDKVFRNKTGKLALNKFVKFCLKRNKNLLNSVRRRLETQDYLKYKNRCFITGRCGGMLSTLKMSRITLLRENRQVHFFGK